MGGEWLFGHVGICFPRFHVNTLHYAGHVPLSVTNNFGPMNPGAEQGMLRDVWGGLGLRKDGNSVGPMVSLVWCSEDDEDAVCL